MSATRRATLPGADELFRSTSPAVEAAPVEAATPEPAPVAPAPEPPATPGVLAPAPSAPLAAVPAARGAAAPRAAGAPRTPTGRERHDKKITVYLSPAELVEIERARLTLASDQGIYVDRGRIVREAVAVVLADLEDKGGASILVRRLHAT